jgi:hypothetical protein
MAPRSAVAPTIASSQRRAAPKTGDCACGGGCPRCRAKLPIQTKLAVSEPGDAFEQEADRVAGQILRAPAPDVSHGAKREAEAAPRVTPLRSSVSRKKTRDGEHGVADETMEQEPVPRTPGRSLPASARAFFEPRFGRDFGHVRVHADAEAARSAQALGARAYTAGAHIVFGAGEYRPDTDRGRGLLAHELVHTVQQSAQSGAHAPMIQRQTGDQQAQSGGGQQGQAQQQGQGQQQGQAQQQSGQGAPAPAPAPARSACDLAIDDIVAQSLPLLRDAIGQLTNYEPAQHAVENGGPTTPEVTRVGTALDYDFHTRESGYAQIIRKRLEMMEQRLSSRANLSLTCAVPGDPECAVVSFTHSTEAYTPDVDKVVFCKVGTTGSRPTYTFIHELAHAVMPNFGSMTPPTTKADTPTDRAYEHQRLYHYLSPEEALDNAESYGLLVQHLVARQTTPAATPYTDSISGCTDTASVNVAVARAEDWNLIAARWMAAAATLVQRSNAPLDPTDAARITPHFSGTGLTDLQRLQANYQAIADSFNNSVDVRCAKGSAGCGSGVLGWGRDKNATASAVGNAAAAGADFFINLCPAWFGTDLETRVRSVYALYILSRPNHIVTNPQSNVLLKRDQAYEYVDLAHDLYTKERPPPKAQFLLEHQLADYKVQLAQIQAQLDSIDARLKALGVELEQLKRDMNRTQPGGTGQ